MVVYELHIYCRLSHLWLLPYQNHPLSKISSEVWWRSTQPSPAAVEEWCHVSLRFSVQCALKPVSRETLLLIYIYLICSWLLPWKVKNTSPGQWDLCLFALSNSKVPGIWLLFCCCFVIAFCNCIFHFLFLRTHIWEFRSACVTMCTGQDVQEDIKVLIQSDDLLDS